MLDKAAEVPGAASATGVVSGFTAVADKHGKLAGGNWQSAGGNYWGTKDARYPLTSGHAPHGANEVLLDAKTAQRAGYKVGDTYGSRSTAPCSPRPSRASSPPTTAT